MDSPQSTSAPKDAQQQRPNGDGDGDGDREGEGEGDYGWLDLALVLPVNKMLASGRMAIRCISGVHWIGFQISGKAGRSDEASGTLCPYCTPCGYFIILGTPYSAVFFFDGAHTDVNVTATETLCCLCRCVSVFDSHRHGHLTKLRIVLDDGRISSPAVRAPEAA